MHKELNRTSRQRFVLICHSGLRVLWTSPIGTAKAPLSQMREVFEQFAGTQDRQMSVRQSPGKAPHDVGAHCRGNEKLHLAVVGFSL